MGRKAGSCWLQWPMIDGLLPEMLMGHYWESVERRKAVLSQQLQSRPLGSVVLTLEDREVYASSPRRSFCDMLLVG